MGQIQPCQCLTAHCNKRRVFYPTRYNITRVFPPVESLDLCSSPHPYQVLPCFQWSSWRDLALSAWHRDWEGRITCNRNYNYDTIQLPNMDDLQHEIFHTSYPLPGGVQTAYLLNILSFSQPTDRNERQPSHTCNNPTRGGTPYIDYFVDLYQEFKQSRLWTLTSKQSRGSTGHSAAAGKILVRDKQSSLLEYV